MLFLDTTYKITRANEITKISRSVVTSLNDYDFSQEVVRLALEKDVSIIVSNREGNYLVSGNTDLLANNLSRLDANKVNQYLEEMDSKDSMVLYFNHDGSRIFKYDDVFSLLSSSFFSKDSNSVRGLIYGVRAQNIAGVDRYVVVYGSIAPVTSTVTALAQQLLLVSLMLVIVSIVISLIASRRISKPIVRLNDQAITIGNGNYVFEYVRSGYIEIDQLSTSMENLAHSLLQLEKMQKDLIANVSHDLRTPLTMIAGYGEVMRDIPGENTPENVQVIIDEANRLTALVNNMLDISKLQAGAVSIAFSRFSTDELMKEVTSSYHRLTEKHGIKLDVINDGNEYYAVGDLHRIKQALYNLINNAINYIGEDKRVIVSYQRVGNSIRFEVIDHGKGIPEDAIDLIWHRYYRLEKNKEIKVTGTGLGLSIVKTIFELHNAKYGVESVVGEGSSFWFELVCDGVKTKDENKG